MTADSERHRELSQLEERLSETQEQAAWYQHKHQAAVKRVDQLKVHSMTTHLHSLIVMYIQEPMAPHEVGP